MSKVELTFGRSALEAQTAQQLLVLEQEQNRSIRFMQVDALVADVVLRSLHEQKVAELIHDKADNTRLKLPDLPDAQHAFVEETFGLERQRGRGALFHPARVSLKVGLANLPYSFAKHGRFGYGMAWEHRGQVEIKESAEALLFWALLEPLFDLMYLPLTLRSQFAGKKTRDEQQALWAEIDAFYDAVGWQAEEELAVMRWGGGWHKLQVAEQWQAKKRLIATLASQSQPSIGTLMRTHHVRSLIMAYYKKAKSGQATRKQVLTKALERVLAGWFGGDWLEFLAYLGETPYPSEQIMTALPEPRVFVGGTSRAVEIAENAGLPADEVQKIIAALWQQSGASPVEERVAVLRRYWQAFNVIHDHQKPGMAPLWGLVDEDTYLSLLTPDDQDHIPYTSGLYRKRLPADLLYDIERLWGTIMLPQYPDAIVTEVFPHTKMADVLGPALTFWHGSALTAWFVCEGPMSRTDMAGLAHYHRRELDELEKAGTPIDPRLFDDLIAGEKSLGPEQTVEQNKQITQVGMIAMTVSSTYTRRDGFDYLRDIISRHRRAWAERYWEKYLRYCWEAKVREAATQHALLLGQKGKPPTLKQFSRHAVSATNDWFGGDISKLYAAIGEKAPCQPQYTRSMPIDVRTFVQRVAQFLTSKLPSQNSLAQYAVWYMQIQEAIGKPPTITQFGPHKLEWPAQQTNMAPDQLWSVFVEAILAAM